MTAEIQAPTTPGAFSMGAAQGMGAAIRQQLKDGPVTLGCACGALSQSFTRHSFDGTGAMRPAELSALAQVVDHITARDSIAHRLTRVV